MSAFFFVGDCGVQINFPLLLSPSILQSFSFSSWPILRDGKGGGGFFYSGRRKEFSVSRIHPRLFCGFSCFLPSLLFLVYVRSIGIACCSVCRAAKGGKIQRTWYLVKNIIAEKKNLHFRLQCYPGFECCQRF